MDAAWLQARTGGISHVEGPLRPRPSARLDARSGVRGAVLAGGGDGRTGAAAGVRDRRVRRFWFDGGPSRGNQGSQGRAGTGRGAARPRRDWAADAHGPCRLRPPARRLRRRGAAAAARAAGRPALHRHLGEDEPARPRPPDDGPARGGQVDAAGAGQAQLDPDPRRRRQLPAECVCGRRGAAPRWHRDPRRRPRLEAQRRNDHGVPAADHGRTAIQCAHPRADLCRRG